MTNVTSIAWCDRSWNAHRGCSRVSPGCGKAEEGGCYAEAIAARFSGPGQPFEGFAERKNGHAHWTGKVELLEDELQKALRWRWPAKFFKDHGRKPRVFTPSMSDPFHEGFTDEQIDKFLAVMALRPDVIFQVLTKRAKRMREYFTEDEPDQLVMRWGIAAGAFLDGDWIWREGKKLRPRIEDFIGAAHGLERDCETFIGADDEVPFPLPNVWLGVSVEDQATADERIPELLDTPAAVRFVSLEPLLSPVDLRSYIGAQKRKGSISWCIVGGESGPNARPFDLAWARSARDQCKAAGTKLFMKQLGRRPFGTDPQQQGWGSLGLKDSHGGDESEWPADLQGCREFPGETT